jgi:hypothetical protein
LPVFIEIYSSSVSGPRCGIGKTIELATGGYMKLPLKHLPLRTYYRGIEISPESDTFLLETMNRLGTEVPDEAINAALKAFLKVADEIERSD